MSCAGLLISTFFINFIPGNAQIQTEPFEIQWEWQKQAVPDRHTSLLVDFDEQNSIVTAGFARGFERGEIYRGTFHQQGKWGGAVNLARDASIGHFRAETNVNSLQGTIEMWVKSDPGQNIWTNGEEHWFITAQGYTEERNKPAIGLFKRSEDNAMVLFQAPNWNYAPERSIVYYPGDLAADDWHHIMISWEQEEGRLWLTVNGKGVTGALGESFSAYPFFILWLGSSGDDRQSFAPLGGSMDHLHVSDVTAEERNKNTPGSTQNARGSTINVPGSTQQINLEAMATAEQVLRNWFGFMERVQKANGGWANCYTYPTLLPSPTGSRQFIKPEGYVGNDKGHVGPAMCWLIYASEIFREPWYLQMARKMADAFVDAQNEEGAWAMDYWSTPAGLIPTMQRNRVKLQDQNQVHPMYLLIYLHRITGEERYLNSALKAGNFLLKAQNPNGSWSHSFDLEQGIGVTARGYPQGGEINDDASNDGMTAMLMMYHLTGEMKYLEAYKRCADWFLKAQLGPPTYGWAMQYDKDNNPVWARGQEPPSMAIGAGYLATRALRQAYWVTGDEKYLRAPKKFFQWMIDASDDHQYSSWYDWQTARPIVSTPRASGRIFHVDDPDELAEFLQIAVRIQYADMRQYDPQGMMEQIRKDLISNKPPLRVPEPDLRSIEEGAADTVEKIFEAARTQNEMGGWLSTGQGELRAAGSVIWIRQPRVLEMLRWVEDMRILTGERPPVYFGRGMIEISAYPFNDWYDTPLRE